MISNSIRADLPPRGNRMNIGEFANVVKTTKVHSLGDAFPRATNRRKSVLDIGAETAEQIQREKELVEVGRRVRHKDIDHMLGVSVGGRELMDGLVSKEELTQYLAENADGIDGEDISEMERAHNAMLEKFECKMKKQQQQQQQAGLAVLTKEHQTRNPTNGPHSYSERDNVSVRPGRLQLQEASCPSPTAAMAAASPFNKILQLASTHWADKPSQDTDSPSTPWSLKSGPLSAEYGAPTSTLSTNQDRSFHGRRSGNGYFAASLGSRPHSTAGGSLPFHRQSVEQPSSMTNNVCFSPTNMIGTTGRNRPRSQTFLDVEPDMIAPASPASGRHDSVLNRYPSSGLGGPASPSSRRPGTATGLDANSPGPKHTSSGPVKRGCSFRSTTPSPAGVQGRTASVTMPDTGRGGRAGRQGVDIFSVMALALQSAVSLIDTTDRDYIPVSRTKSEAALSRQSFQASLDYDGIESPSGRTALKGRRAAGAGLLNN